MNAITALGGSVGTRGACAALNVHRSRYYRFRRPKLPARRVAPPLKLSDGERRHIHELLLSPSFVDQAPATVVANLLDDGTYLCSARTMYRILHEHQQVHERRRGHRRAHYVKPELVAGKPKIFSPLTLLGFQVVDSYCFQSTACEIAVGSCRSASRVV